MASTASSFALAYCEEAATSKALFDPAAILTDAELAQHLQQLLQPKTTATTTDNVLTYIFTSETTGQSKCSVVTKCMTLAEVEW